MVIIDDIGVRVSHWLMAMRMAMRFRTFPTLMGMIVMDIVGMFVFVEFLGMFVSQDVPVLLWPQRRSQGSEYEYAHTE